MKCYSRYKAFAVFLLSHTHHTLIVYYIAKEYMRNFIIPPKVITLRELPLNRQYTNIPRSIYRLSFYNFPDRERESRKKESIISEMMKRWRATQRTLYVYVIIFGKTSRVSLSPRRKLFRTEKSRRLNETHTLYANFKSELSETIVTLQHTGWKE